jgi:hypothetical protein
VQLIPVGSSKKGMILDILNPLGTEASGCIR